MSRQVPPGFDIQHKKPCRNIISLCLNSLVKFFSCSVATCYHLSQHNSSSIFSPLCCDIRNIVVTDFLSHLLERCRDTQKSVTTSTAVIALFFFFLAGFSPF